MEENAPDGRRDEGLTLSRRVPLVACHLLDPRPGDEAAALPIADAVNIPFDELPERTHELPSKRVPVRVAAVGAPAVATTAWLERVGRTPVVVEFFRHRAEGAEFVGRLWEPQPSLVHVVPRLRPGRAVDLACGSGRDAVYLAACGWDVIGVDRLPDALDRARDLGRRCAAAIRPVRWVEADLETDTDPLESVLTDGPVDLVTGFRYLHRRLFTHMVDWLRPGGSVVYETFTTVNRERFGRPAREAFVLRPGELRELLCDLEVREYAEGWHEGAHTARAWAIRPD